MYGYSREHQRTPFRQCAHDIISTTSLARIFSYDYFIFRHYNYRSIMHTSMY